MTAQRFSGRDESSERRCCIWSPLGPARTTRCWAKWPAKRNSSRQNAEPALIRLQPVRPAVHCKRKNGLALTGVVAIIHRHFCKCGRSSCLCRLPESGCCSPGGSNHVVHTLPGRCRCGSLCRYPPDALRQLRCGNLARSGPQIGIEDTTGPGITGTLVAGTWSQSPRNFSVTSRTVSLSGTRELFRS